MDFVENISKGFWFCFNPSFSCYPLNLLLTFFEEHVAIETLKLNRHSRLIFYVTVLLMPNLKTQLAIIAIRALKLSKTFSEPAKSAVQRNTPILCIHYMQDTALHRHSLFYLLQGDLTDQEEGDGQGLRSAVNSIPTAPGFSVKSEFLVPGVASQVEARGLRSHRGRPAGPIAERARGGAAGRGGAGFGCSLLGSRA